MENLYKTFLMTGLIWAAMSCSEKKSSELLIIPVDTSQDVVLSLSEIANEIEAIPLEMTDESLISKVLKTIICDDYIFVLSRSGVGDNILAFDRHGKFIRSIGALGQGPGEYTFLGDITADRMNKRLYTVSSNHKLICFGFDGQLIKENSAYDFPLVHSLSYANNELLLIVEYPHEQDEIGKNNRAALYRLNDNLQITDTMDIRKIYVERGVIISYPLNDYITSNKSDTYFYFPELTITHFLSKPETSLRDTLYRFENNQLIPHLKLSFKNPVIADGARTIQLLDIYRSSRFVFSAYKQNITDEDDYFLCYDIRTGKGYNMKTGYNDDINHIGKAAIRPLDSNTEQFYYLHTPIEEDDVEEPNPTLYIGTLKPL
ncbi:hypothetical protein FACS189411_12210 [Bacteroidia bacterium]|nr:hypothetical protein FACS189411_12210 [Bacteroidia bacterium]